MAAIEIRGAQHVIRGCSFDSSVVAVPATDRESTVDEIRFELVGVSDATREALRLLEGRRVNVRLTVEPLPD